MTTVFFDIDGTLIDAAGAGRQAMVGTLRRQFDIDFDDSQVTFAGRTDRSLVNELLGQHGKVASDAEFDEFLDSFVQALAAALPERPGTVLPGVVNLLEKLSESGHVRLGIITGNLRRAARVKLEHFGLAKYFCSQGEGIVGGFGDRHADRNDVARAAMRELTDLQGAAPTTDVWVVGDTRHDVACGRAVGARVLAVETGSFDRNDLAPSKPDLILSDLTLASEWADSLIGSTS